MAARCIAFWLAALAFVTAGCDGDDSPRVPAAPSDLEVADLGGAGHLTWTDNSDDEDEFIITRAVDDGDLEERARTVFDTPTFHDEPLAAGAYTWVVYASNDEGISEPSNDAMLTVP